MLARRGPNGRKECRSATLPPMARLLAAVACVLAALASSPAALAFTHIVQRSEILAQIAERTYGRIQYEQILVAANALDAQGGSPIVPGQRLEIPTVSYHRVGPNESWDSMAVALLGDASRSTILAQANDSVPWIPPSEGAEIVVPYNLRYLAAQDDTMPTITQKFWGDKNKSWLLDQYNHMKGQPVRRGDVVLIPLTNLPLTEAGKMEALSEQGSGKAQTLGQAREAQRKVDAEMPLLLGDVRSGRFVDAITRGVRMLALGDLTKPQLSTLHRQLVEAYVALDASGLAAASCAAWRDNDPRARLDPLALSPKILAACSKRQP
jgi:hypothetical protein